MDFYSLKFVVFLVLSLFVYYMAFKIIPTRQWMTLLISSLTFYALCDFKSMTFIVTTAVVTWIGAIENQRMGKAYQLVKSDKTTDREYKKCIKEKVLFKRRLVLVAVLVINFVSVR